MNDDYPEFICINGEDYAINTDFRYALACFACINDSELSEYERAYGVLGILYQDEPEDTKEALRLAIKFLRCGKDEEALSRRADMDFEYDMHYIRSSFRSDYGIDLKGGQMHWYEFCELLQGLTDECILNRVRDIRNYDLSTVKDAKLRQKIVQAQRELKLPARFTKEEEDALDAFYAQLEC